MSDTRLELSPVLHAATEHQPRARLALSAALATGPAHAYLFRGPRGTGKAAAARAFAAEILCLGADRPEDVRRRALLSPSPHPDLVWLFPAGAQHLVEELREQVIRAASYRPFEGTRRVFVIEEAEAMRDESQNALLKTLEEPPGFVHILLVSSEPAALLETVRSRCQVVDFVPLPAAAIETSLGPGEDADEVAAVARLAAGNLERARFLLSDEGRRVRLHAQECVSAALARKAEPAPWRGLLDDAEALGADVEETTRAALEEAADAGVKQSSKEIGEAAKRAARRRRTEVLDLGLELWAAWIRDLAVVAAEAPDVAFNRDRLAELQAQAASIDTARGRRGVELVQDTRRRLELNVSEELAMEALFSRLERLLAAPGT